MTRGTPARDNSLTYLLPLFTNFTEHQSDVFSAMWKGLNNGQRDVLTPHLQSIVADAGTLVNPFAMTVMMSNELQNFFRHSEGTEPAQHASNVSEFFDKFSDLSVGALREILAMIGVRPPQYVGEEDSSTLSARVSALTGDTLGRYAGVASMPKEE